MKTSKKAICVEAKAPVRVYFLNILGINYVDIRARAAAKLESESLDEDTGFAVPYHKQYTVPDYIFNKAGKEIRIVRDPGSCDILVYVGLDNKNGEKTRWVNITGTSSDPVGLVQTFDIGAVSAAKYIRVINDTYTTTPFNISVYLINTAKLIKYSEYASL